jgi:hypothetical protein
MQIPKLPESFHRFAGLIFPVSRGGGISSSDQRLQKLSLVFTIMSILFCTFLLLSFATHLVAERGVSLSLRGNGITEHKVSKQEVFADPPESNYFTTGWWYGEVTASKTCDIDDDGGDNQVVSFEGYALNTCIFQGGEYLKYQCDGGKSRYVYMVEKRSTALNFSLWIPGPI